MTDNKYTAYCGLCCSHCYSRTHIAPTAEKLKEQMKAQGFESFGPYMQDYTEFWRFISTLTEAEGCPGCRQGGGNPACAMRDCAQGKQTEACPLCSEYPCDKFDWLNTSEAYPMLESDNALMQELGTEAWEMMQKERRDKGFTYVEERKKYKE